MILHINKGVEVHLGCLLKVLVRGGWWWLHPSLHHEVISR
ncbi:hypothetical protein SAMN05421665_1231 [Yoonia rosea]|uniref:Uncharacterized protein n=1 Tax=Yoonia rosea TaxID=287098 RepID=A0A1R3WUD1_9RHOB|nr:hypothetical protein SAMN05421665_1231 [Yoonia rosea]